MKMAPLEERIYRHRCVEAWSIVVPWIGYSLSALLKSVGVQPKAKYVAFQSDYDRKQMPHALRNPFPYVEGLRLDEAMHPLALLCFGMYGGDAAAAGRRAGAPGRAVEVRLQEHQVDRENQAGGEAAALHLERLASNEYGFYSNVNPHVDHPRWSQATERRLGEFFMRPTLMFNGYEKEVAGLYTGMDLKKNF